MANPFNGIRVIGVLISSLIFFIAIVYIYDYSPHGLWGSDDEDLAVMELEAVRVQEYQGARLDSTAAFRENSIKGPQSVEVDGYRLGITGLVEEEQSLTYGEVLAFPSYSKVVTLYCVEGWDATVLWEGVLVRDLLQEAGIGPSANTVIFHAEDGYTSALPLDYIVDSNILLAYKINGVTLPEDNGFPFQVVAEDKWGYKWVRWVTKIELSDDPEYLGYWESRGYSNDGDLVQGVKDLKESHGE